MRRKWITVLRIFRYGLNNFSRNAWLSTAATIVMVVTLTIVLSTFVARMVFADTIDQIRQKIDVSIYLKDTVDEEQRDKLVGAIKEVPIVTDIDYISKEQAREVFKQQNKADYEQLEALGELGQENPFPASLRVHTKDPNRLEEINKVINQQEFADMQSAPASISGARKAAIENIARVSQFSEIFGMVASVIFVIISIMIIFNTIRMAIFNRKDEIEIMKLIGAEKSFIRGPFIVEASMYGVLAALVSVALIYLVLMTAGSGLSNYDIEVGPTIKFFADWPLLIMLGQVLVGIGIGVLSSFLAMRRYLKV
ncbi:MAG: cell division protein FtsX [Candidatus Saccharimonadales bacterium]